MDIYIFIGSLISGIIGFMLALIEVKIINTFVVKNQGLENVPVLDENLRYSSKDKQIRKFRWFIISRQNKSNQSFSTIRNKIIILNILSISFFLLLGAGVAYLYFSSK